MSEEEIIKIVNEITPDDLLNCWEGGEKEYNAILGLLDLYNKEKEKNKELEDRIKEYETLINRQKELEQEKDNLMKQGWL